MEKTDIKIYFEKKPKHYIGHKIGITFNYNCEDWEIKTISELVQNVLETNEYKVETQKEI